MSEKRYLVTSALPYANGPIHFGHIAGAYLPADVFVRYLRLKGEDVVYICGTDEYGVAITINAERQGMTPRELVDKYHQVIKTTFDRFRISFDNFSGTARPEHGRTAQGFFTELLDKGFIKKQPDRQFYCPQDAMFLPDRYIEGTCPKCGHEKARGDECPACGGWLNALEIKSPRCSICGSEPEARDTEHWFLQLQELQPRLEEWLATKGNWKSNVMTFVQGMLKQGLQPRPVTRDISWGIPVPLDGAAGKVLYVWFDAPIGYISSTKEWALAQGDPDLWKKYWQSPESRLIHFIGKDNIPFHTIVFPAMLMGMGGEWVLPADVPANEFYFFEGRKFSTSEGWYIDLDDFFSKYSSDSVRFAVIANAPENKDTEFGWKDFQMRNNAALADSLGNFINRTLTFIEKFFAGKVPEPGTLDASAQALLAKRAGTVAEIGELVEGYSFRKAAESFIALSREGNRYFDEQAPWKSRTENPAACATALWTCVQLTLTLGQIARLFIPDAAERIFAMLGMGMDGLDWSAGGSATLPAGSALGRPEVLFRKIEDAEIEKELAALRERSAAAVGSATAASAESATCPVAAAAPQKAEIEYDDFSRLDLRVGIIRSAERKQGSKKIIRMQVETAGGVRQVLGGLGESYTPEALVGKRVIVVCNLKPRTIMGETSAGMLLAAADGSGLHLLGPDGEADAGSPVS